MNYTLKQLTSMSFEDWAALIQTEETGTDIDMNKKVYEILVSNVIKMSLTNLSYYRSFSLCNFSTV